MVWFYSMDFRRNWHGNLQGTCDVDYGRSYDENRDFKPWIGPSDKLYSLCASVHGPRMGKQVKRPQIRCLPHVMGRSVAPVDGIHCRPHADHAKPSASGKQDFGESFFSVAKRHFFCCLHMAVGSTRY